jgi:hypothetical protein
VFECFDFTANLDSLVPVAADCRREERPQLLRAPMSDLDVFFERHHG